MSEFSRNLLISTLISQNADRHCYDYFIQTDENNCDRFCLPYLNPFKVS